MFRAMLKCGPPPQSSLFPPLPFSVPGTGLRLRRWGARSEYRGVPRGAGDGHHPQRVPGPAGQRPCAGPPTPPPPPRVRVWLTARIHEAVWVGRVGAWRQKLDHLYRSVQGDFMKLPFEVCLCVVVWSFSFLAVLGVKVLLVYLGPCQVLSGSTTSQIRNHHSTGCSPSRPPATRRTG